MLLEQFEQLVCYAAGLVLVTCDVAYLCANSSLPRPLCSRRRPDVRHRQMSEKRQT